MEQKNIEWLLRNLPTTPDPELLYWARKTQLEELGGEYLLFEHTRVQEPPAMYQLMDNDTRWKSRWMTRCGCTACGSEFYTEKAGRRSFYLLDGEDGESYPIGPGDGEDPDLPGTGMTVEYTEGDGVRCPYCGEELTILHTGTVRGGRKKQIQVAQMVNVGRFTTILYWLVNRQISEHGTDLGAEPRYAYVLGDKGELVAFSHRRPGVYGKDAPDHRWHRLRDTVDRWDNRYHDWGSINDTKCGSDGFRGIPTECAMAGTTGEKTGLWRYWKEEDGYRPVEYLKLWKKHRNVENLVNAGFAELVMNAISEGLRYGADTGVELQKAADLKEKKPAAMLGVTRAEMQIVKKSLEPYGLLTAWREYRSAGGRAGMEEIASAYKKFGKNTIYTAARLISSYGDCDIDRLERYMEKQKRSLRELGLLLDTRGMARDMAGGRVLTAEELWPRDLQSAHDRLNALRVVQQSKEKSAKLQAGFDRVLETYGDLQWNDGHLTVILPKSNQDLVLEGAILRHCVGGYGEKHAEGKNIILFIRHHRRPERSYYTLNISFRGDSPREIQLHGYGNERHGKHKQYTHSIPKEVRAFVDRWEREILAPWWRCHRAEFEKEKKTA